MKMSEAFPSKYLKASDVVGKRIKVTIDRVESEEMQDGEHKPVLYFQGKEKGVVLNKTNASTLADEYGDDSDGWAGKVIVLTTWKTRNPEGKPVDGILVNLLSTGGNGKAAIPVPKLQSFEQAAAQMHASDDMDDQVPF